MADNEIKISLRADGGQQAASEILATSEAIRETTEAIEGHATESERAADGAKDLSEGLKEVSKEVVKQGEDSARANIKITDTTRQSSEAVKENIKAFEEWQKELRAAAREAGRSALAVDPATVGAGLEEVAEKSRTAATTIKAVSEVAQELDTDGGDAGKAVLQFGRAFDQAQYGIRGVLSSLPRLVMALGGSAGLAGALSVAAVAGYQLWKKMQEGPQEAEKEVKSLIDQINELVDVYRQLESGDIDERTKRMSDAERERLRATAKLERDTAAALATQSLLSIRDRAELEISLLMQRVKLEQVELAQRSASGRTLVELTQQRADIVEGILATEQAIAEVSRKAALDAANARKISAEERLDIAKAGDMQLQAEALPLRAERDRMLAEQERLMNSRLSDQEDQRAKIDKAWSEINAKRERLADLPQGDPYALDRNMLKLEIEALEKRLPALNEKFIAAGEVSREETELISKIKIADENLAGLTAQLEASEAAQREASAAMMEAARAMMEIRQTQAIQRDQEVASSALTRQNESSSKTTEQAVAAIETIEGAAQEQGREINAQEAEAIGRIRQMLQDNIPDGAQAEQIAGILQSFSATLSQRDQTLISELERVQKVIADSGQEYTSFGNKVLQMSRSAESAIRNLGTEVLGIKQRLDQMR